MFKRITGLPIRELILAGWMPSGLKKWFYRRRGYNIHPTAQFALGSVIVGTDVEIGPEVSLGLLTIIKARTVSLGARVRIGSMSVLDTFALKVGEGTRIGNQVVVGGLATPRSALTLGRNCILMEWSFINTTLPVVVGDEVGIGGHCLLFTHGLWPNGFEGFPVNFGPITIEDEAWLAWRVTVLPGVTIGKRSILSSDACVIKSIPPLSLAAGVPAKVLRENGTYIQEIDPDKNRQRLAELVKEFCEWVPFMGGEAREEGDLLSFRWGKSREKAGRILVHSSGTTPVFDGKLRAGDVAVSLSPIDDTARRNLEAAGAAWLDITRKERSLTTNELADEFEEFLRRSGLRLLKYGRYG
jgi:acetyltransferase-like isoleucine patch superfamily enzyme